MAALASASYSNILDYMLEKEEQFQYKVHLYEVEEY